MTMPNEMIRLSDHLVERSSSDGSGDAGSSNKGASSARPSRAQAEQAVRTLLEYIGEDASREGLAETPKRVVKAYEEWTSGYAIDADGLLAKSFDEVEGYSDMVLLRDIPFTSRCEHHLAPIIGKAHVAYLPNGSVVGISKLARVVEAYAKRLQIQERMTQEIVGSLSRALNPRGIAVMIEAEHHCMTTRGINTHGTVMTTKRFTGEFDTDPQLRQDFLASIRG